jgi:hypothetical protein
MGEITIVWKLVKYKFGVCVINLIIQFDFS